MASTTGKPGGELRSVDSESSQGTTTRTWVSPVVTSLVDFPTCTEVPGRPGQVQLEFAVRIPAVVHAQRILAVRNRRQRERTVRSRLRHILPRDSVSATYDKTSLALDETATAKTISRKTSSV